MYSINFSFPQRKTGRHSMMVAKLLLTSLLAGSLVILSSCGNSGSGTRSGDTATSQGSHKPFEALSSLHMIDEMTGWATTQHFILRTSDGGINWKDATPPGHALVPGSGVYFLNSSNAWVALPADTGTNTLILHTGDGGQTWQRTSASTDRSSYLQIIFVDTQHGWLMSHMGGAPQAEKVAIFRTTDGGQTWMQVTVVLPASTDGPPPGKLPFGGSKSGLNFLNTSTGWVNGSVPVTNLTWFFVTHDGGSTWQQQALPPLASKITGQLSLLSPMFFTTSDGILPANILGENAAAFTIYVTHDGGSTWQAMSLLDTSISSFSFINAQQGWAIDKDGKTLYTTSDGGQHWTKLNYTLTSGGQLSFKSLDFVTSNTGWAIGTTNANTSLLFKTADGGKTWNLITYSIS